MTEIELHKELLKKKNYVFKANVKGMSLTELSLVNNFGYWFEALSTGSISPLSELQRQFISVTKGKVSPKTEHEMAWVKYRVLTVLSDVINQINEGDYSHIQRIPRNDFVVDAVISALNAYETESGSYLVRANCQKGIAKVRDHQNKGKSQSRNNITNYGGLHDFGL
ncbi:DUF413 domain-containing protein [Enterovibrio sp. ZSDZ42]|uniref:Macrodomain Ori protein n=1 Tax=Enterovibrio gelatinilyticus TaxID=2899819 RepID=A0ABT5R849_9GAMM|nr:DUF413 domain-containing protein [Enterovibrio sp. ZSDZ42]MDD1796445.1 DUF413 domain-containing protein [Enterovibrio sp. ZSDZ42]